MAGDIVARTTSGRDAIVFDVWKVSESISRRFQICSQRNAVVERKLKIEEFRMGFDLLHRSQHKPCLNSQLFAEYISTVLFSCIDEPRSNEEFADKKAVLLMDNCFIHVQAETLQTLVDHWVKVITFPPHTTHTFRSLDLSLFGNLQKK
jgi:hypothetical protein